MFVFISMQIYRFLLHGITTNESIRQVNILEQKIPGKSVGSASVDKLLACFRKPVPSLHYC